MVYDLPRRRPCQRRDDGRDRAARTQPATVPASATAAVSPNVCSSICQRRAPAQSSRRRASADVAPQRGRSQHGERKQQRARLAAEQEQPARGDPRRRDRRGERVGRSDHLELIRARTRARRGSRSTCRVCADGPRVHVTAADRHEPRVRTEERRELLRPRQALDALRDHDRRRLRRVVPNRPRDLLGGGAGWMHGAKGASGSKRRGPTSTRRSPGVDGIGPFPSAAAPRNATARMSSAAGRRRAGRSAEAVSCAQVDEPSLDRRLAIQHAASVCVPGAPRIPRTSHRACHTRRRRDHATSRSPRRERRGRVRERPVLHHEAARRAPRRSRPSPRGHRLRRARAARRPRRGASARA